MLFGCGPGSTAGFVRDVVKSFRSQHPDAGFRISCLPAAARAEGVGNGSLDIACVRLPEPDIVEMARRSLYIEDLCEDPLVLVAVEGVPGFDEIQSTVEKTVAPRALPRIPLILPEPNTGMRRDFDRRCRDAGILDRLKTVVEVGPWGTALDYVRDGVGAGLIPRSAAKVTGLVFKPLAPKLSPPNTLRAICRKKAGTDELDLSELGQSFLQTVRVCSKAYVA